MIRSVKKKVILLGSTGSIGRQSIDVLKTHSDRFEVIGISASRDSEILRAQATELKPSVIACVQEADRSAYPENSEIWCGEQASERLAEIPCDVIIVAISGFGALKPLISALAHTKRVAIANKESLVCGGAFVTDLIKKNGVNLVPIDSEQSAIFQCLQGGKLDEVKRLILTASGGPFFGLEKKDLRNVSIEEVLKHPTWNMGRKITLDSATMFNKGLEIMEASRLFEVGADQISVLIHPQSVVHSLVEFFDGSVIANLAIPDMRLPIQYALTYPERIPSSVKRLDLTACSGLTFFNADEDRFPAIRMAYESLRMEKGYPVVYNGANEMAAELYFRGAIGFTEIETYVEEALNAYAPSDVDSVDAIFDIDRWSRSYVKQRYNEG